MGNKLFCQLCGKPATCRVLDSRGQGGTPSCDACAERVLIQLDAAAFAVAQRGYIPEADPESWDVSALVGAVA